MLTRIGRLLLGISSAGLGAVLVWKGLTLPWQPLLTWPATSALPAYAIGAFLIVTGLLALSRRFSVAILGLGLGWFLLGLPAVLGKPTAFLSWYGVTEAVSFACGGWAVIASLGGQSGVLKSLAARPGSQRLAQALCGLTFIFYGISHFLLLKFTANLIPHVFPGPMTLAALTGAAHIAAGVALVTGVLARLGVTLQALMCTAFGVIVQIPILMAKPAERQQWVEVFASFALAGAAFAIAGALEAKPWLPFGRGRVAE